MASRVKCSKCSTHVKPGTKFCIKCGERIVVSCSSESSSPTMPVVRTSLRSPRASRLSRGPSDDALSLASPVDDAEGSRTFTATLYGLSVYGLLEGAHVWYLAAPVCSLLGVDSGRSVCLSFPNSQAKRLRGISELPDGVPKARDGTVLVVSRVGMLRLIAHGTNAQAISIQSSIADGLVQFDEAEALIKDAHVSSASLSRLSQQKHNALVDEEFEEWERERARKRAERQRKRAERKARLALLEAGTDTKSVAKKATPSPADRRAAFLTRSPSGKDDSRTSLRDLAQVQHKALEQEQHRRSSRLLQLQEARREAVEAAIREEGGDAAAVSDADAVLDEVDEAEEVDEALYEVDGTGGKVYNIAKDPTRQLKDVPAPTRVRLTAAQVFSKEGRPKLSLLRKHFLREGRLTEEAALQLLSEASAVMRKEPNLLELVGPTVVFGDIHGQFWDLLTLIKKSGKPSSTQQLWLGDYVDRGTFGTEVAFYLLASKVKYPKTVYLLRGNHESRQMAEYFNFKQECLYKYSETVYKAFMSCFDCLPLAGTITTTQGRFMCVHGGLSPYIRQVTDVNRLERFSEPPTYGPMCDLLWSDPMDDQPTYGMSKHDLEKWQAVDFEDNSQRGCGYKYGLEACKRFLEDNQLGCIVRAHEVKKRGYEEHRFRASGRKLPMVISVFSAPNYCDTYENRAAFLRFEDDKYAFAQIGWAPHPFYLSDFSNVFEMSLPMVAENITSFFLSILERLEEEDSSEEEEEDSDEAEGEREAKAAIKEKINRMGRSLASMRATKKETLNRSLPSAEFQNLLEGMSQDEAFTKAQLSDSMNEVNPLFLKKA